MVRQHPRDLPVDVVIFERHVGEFRPVDQAGKRLVHLIGVLPAKFVQERRGERLAAQILVQVLDRFQRLGHLVLA